MQISKVATAVALSTGLLFGCNSDGLPIPTDGSTDPTTPTSALLDGYWEFSDTAAFSAAYLSPSSTDLPNVYRFSEDGATLYYYTDNSSDATLGEYERFETTYTETVEDDTSGTVAFTLFNDDGSVGSQVDGDYTATDDDLAIEGNIPVSGTDQGSTDGVKDAVDKTDDELEPITDNFDSYEVGLQIDLANSDYTAPNADGTTIIANISDKYSKSGENSLFLHDNSTIGKPIVSRTFLNGEAESGSVSVSVYIPEDGYTKSSYLYLGTSDSASSDARFADLYFGSSKLTFRGEGGEKENLSSYDKNTWVDVTIDWSFNETTSSYDVVVSINGEEWPEVLTANADAGAPTLFAMYVGDNSNVDTYTYFDNLDSTLFDGADEVLPTADYEWDFSSVEGGIAVGKDLTISKNDDNLKQIVDGANSTDGAVHITQSETEKTYGYYYTTMKGTSDPLAFVDGTYSMEIVFSVDDINFNPGFGQDLQLLENTDSDNGYKLIIDKSSLKPKFRVYNGSGSTSVEAETALTDETFMHLLATFDNGEAKLYVNGVLEKAASKLSFMPNTKDGDKVYIGGGSNSSQKNLEGVLDNAAFFNDVLTADEVAARAQSFGFGTK
jgi:hypothetical protein